MICSLAFSFLLLMSLAVPHVKATALDRTTWTVTVEGDHSPMDSGRSLLDGDELTVCQVNTTASSDAAYNITIDMKSSQEFNGISFLPSQGIPNAPGKLGDVYVYLSDDGTTWGEAIANGTFLHNSDLKAKYFNTSTARFIRLAITDTGNGPHPNVAAAEVNVLAGTPTLRFNITADSQETLIGGYLIGNAVDSDTSTMWHTQFSDPAGAAPFPHWVGFSLLPHRGMR